MKQKIYLIACNAVIAALYAALTLVIAPVAYMNFQFRFTEILIFLAFYDIRFLPGLILGCFLANLASPMLVYDLTFGTAATALAVFGIHFISGKLIKNHTAGLFTVPLIGALANGLLVGLALHLAFQLPYVVTALEVAVGEFAVLLVGVFVFMALQKNRHVADFLHWRLQNGD